MTKHHWLHINISSIFILLAFLLSCSGKDQYVPLNSNKDAPDLNAQQAAQPLVNYSIVVAPNAPTRITRKIKQDREGNLLMASFEGIIKYDGDSFANITKNYGLDQCYAFDVLEDQKGNIWIASNLEGVYKIDAVTKNISNFTTRDGLGDNRNMCIYEDRIGNIWVGGSGGLSRYDGNTFINYRIEDGLPHNNINTIIQDKNGKMWVGTRGNAGVFDGQSFEEITNDEGDSFHNVWSITEDRQGNVWIVDTVGLWRFDGRSYSFISDGGWGFYEDKKGNFWSTDMPRFKPSVLKHLEHNSLVEGKVNAIEMFKTERVFLGMAEDNKGNIWIGSGDGVWCYDGKAVTYYTGKKE